MSSIRLAPYRVKAPIEVKQRIGQVVGDPSEGINGITMYLMGNPAPTTYIVKEEGSDETMKVVIGSQTCTCGGGCVASATPFSSTSTDESFSNKRTSTQEKQQGELCVHLIWVMVKVLRAPPSHPLVWQLSLVDSELDTLLSFKEKEKVAQKKKAFLKRGKGRGGGAVEQSDSIEDTDTRSKDDWIGPITAQQQPVEEDDSCPICLDPLVNNGVDQPLTYCRPSCGNNVHLKCMLEYGEHAAKSSYQPDVFEVKCLLCRASWGIEGLPWLRRTWAKLRHIEVAPGTKGSKIHNSRCAGCYHKPINGNRYRCVKCPSKSKVDLCSHCFGKGGHIHHPFVVQETVGSELLPAPRKGGQQVWRPVAPLSAAGLSADALVALQSRDITPDDFNTLLALDQPPPAVTLGEFLVSTLNVCTSPPETSSCAHCGRLLSESQRPNHKPRKYPCGHTVHIECAEASILEKSYICPIPSCSQPTFPGLQRKVKPPRTETADLDYENIHSSSLSTSGVGDSSSVVYSSNFVPARVRERHTGNVTSEMDFSVMGLAFDGSSSSVGGSGGVMPSALSLRAKATRTRPSRHAPDISGLAIGDVIDGSSVVNSGVGGSGGVIPSASLLRTKSTRTRPSRHTPDISGLAIGDVIDGSSVVNSGVGSSGGGVVMPSASSLRTKATRTRPSRHTPDISGLAIGDVIDGSSVVNSGVGSSSGVMPSASSLRTKATRTRHSRHTPDISGLAIGDVIDGSSVVNSGVGGSGDGGHYRVTNEIDSFVSSTSALSPPRLPSPVASPPRSVLQAESNINTTSMPPRPPNTIDNEQLATEERLRKETRRAEALASMRARKLEERSAADRRRITAEERRNAPLRNAMAIPQADSARKAQREAHMLEVAERRQSLAEQARSASFRRDITRRETETRREIRLLSAESHNQPSTTRVTSHRASTSPAFTPLPESRPQPSRDEVHQPLQIVSTNVPTALIGNHRSTTSQVCRTRVAFRASCTEPSHTTTRNLGDIGVIGGSISIRNGS